MVAQLSAPYPKLSAAIDKEWYGQVNIRAWAIVSSGCPSPTVSGEETRLSRYNNMLSTMGYMDCRRDGRIERTTSMRGIWTEQLPHGNRTQAENE
jgi:hypothetical protein